MNPDRGAHRPRRCSGVPVQGARAHSQRVCRARRAQGWLGGRAPHIALWLVLAVRRLISESVPPSRGSSCGGGGLGSGGRVGGVARSAISSPVASDGRLRPWRQSATGRGGGVLTTRAAQQFGLAKTSGQYVASAGVPLARTRKCARIDQQGVSRC